MRRMTKKIIINFSGVRDDDIDLISKIRNFGEDLMFELSRSGEARVSIDEVDAATDRISFKVAPRFLGSVTRLVKKLLQKHYLDEIADISRG